MSIDNVVGRALMGKPINEAKALLKDMTSNSCH